MSGHSIFGSLALVSLVLLFWQWLVARRFPLHTHGSKADFLPAITILKPLKGVDAETAECLRSWLRLEYPAEVQFICCLDQNDDEIRDLVRILIAEFPEQMVSVVLCDQWIGPNAKVCKLHCALPDVRHDFVVVSDADTLVEPEFLRRLVQPLADEQVGLVNCFYRFANPSTPAMWWEAIGVGADFWSQVLQSNSIKPMDFALGAVMLMRRQALEESGGFRALVDFLADDYELGNRIARRGFRIELSSDVVECHERKVGWGVAWLHQLRWARTIRGCQPAPYFFSILNNVTLWMLLWWATSESVVWPLAVSGLLVRALVGSDLMRRLNRSCDHVPWLWMLYVKDLLGVLIWLIAFLGDSITWRGERYRIRAGGKLEVSNRDKR